MIKIRDSPIIHMIYATFFVTISLAILIDEFLGAWLSNEFERELHHLQMRAERARNRMMTPVNIEFSDEIWNNYCNSIETHEINENSIMELVEMIDDYCHWRASDPEIKIVLDIHVDENAEKIYFSEILPTEGDNLTVTYCWSP
jgi:hypothetical protein